MKAYIDPDSTFREIVDNIEAIKTHVRDTIASFSSFEIKKQLQFQRELRNQIYALDFELWKRERILETIYDDFPVYKLKSMK